MDLSEPHVLGRMPTDLAEAWPRRAQYFLIASYRVFSPGEEAKRKPDENFAKEMVDRTSPGGEPSGRLADAPDGAVLASRAGMPEGEEECTSRKLYFARVWRRKVWAKRCLHCKTYCQ